MILLDIETTVIRLLQQAEQQYLVFHNSVPTKYEVDIRGLYRDIKLIKCLVVLDR